MLSKAHIDSQKAHGRQLNTKVCDIESVIFVILSCFLSSLFNNTNSRLVLTVVFAQTVHNTAHCCSFRRTPFSNVVHIRTHSLVPKPTTSHWSESESSVHMKSQVDQPGSHRMTGTVSSHSSCQGLCHR